MAVNVKRGLTLLLVAFFLFWALSQPAQFAEAVATLADGLGGVLAAVGRLFESILNRFG